MKQVRKTKDIARDVAIVLEAHIGEKNAIARKALFKKIWRDEMKHNADMFNKGVYDQYTVHDIELGYGLRLKDALHYLRAYTHCFPTSKVINNVRSVFVMSTLDEAKHYCNMLDNNIARMTSMKARSKKSIDEKWFAEEWKV